MSTSTPGVSIEELFSLSLSVNSGATAVPVMIGQFVDPDGNLMADRSPMTFSADVTRSLTAGTVVAFSEPNFQGASQLFQPGKYNTGDLTIPNDSIRSLAVPEGWRVTLFEDADFSGEQAVVKAAASSLGAEIDGRTSSLIVENTIG
ncbi:hypothetical protein ABZ705_20325 [Streptomyces sp. NPDC006984]|uniref:hypothetical protein n=1 Tax=Streptomyces sp. NPDC006984 TaxID=3155463 RepID=UPI0033E08A43